MPTFGPSGTPNSKTINLDAVFTSSLANYQRTLFDNITKSNALFFSMKSKGLFEGVDGGAYLQIPLMYGLSTPQAYSGYDTLSVAPTDGITEAQFDWAQAAVPVSISGLEKIRNRKKIFDLVEAKIMQAEMGIKEWFTKAFIQGALLSGSSGASALYTAYSEASNGATFINPLFQLVTYDAGPTSDDQSDVSVSVGGINASTAANSWWRNWCIASAATTYLGLLLEFDKMYDLCSRGPGGPPDLIWVDETTKRLINAAFYAKYLSPMQTDGNYPFENLKFRGAKIICDEFMVDVANATTTPNASGGKGTAVFINTSFMKMKYDSDTNFVAGEFKKPVNQDASVKHILWAGQACVSNRRKFGVIGNIARTLT